MEKDSVAEATSLADGTEKKDLEDDKNKELDPKAAEEDPNASQKITNFFPVVRMSARAKMGSSESKIDKSAIAKGSSKMIASGSGNKSSAATKPEPGKLKNFLSQMPNKDYSAILNTALKTSISEVLRKNIEAHNQSEVSKDRLTNSSKRKSPSSRETDSASTSQNQDPSCSQSREQDANATEDTQITASGSTQEASISQNRGVKADVLPKTSNITKHSSKTFAQVLKGKKSELPSTLGSETDSHSNAPSNEATCQKDKEGENGDKTSNDGVALETVTAKEESSAEPAFPIQHDPAVKPRKNKRRHFKGATYNLYLTPARKKKKLQKKQASDSCVKDDEMSLTSTENGSYIDSSDACSMFSEDFNTSSEKSLVDDEACSNSRCSPIHLPDVKVEPVVQNPASDTKEALPADDKPIVDDITCEIPKSSEELPEDITPIKIELPDASDTAIQQNDSPTEQKYTLDNKPTVEEPETNVQKDYSVAPASSVRVANTRKSASSYSANVCDKALIPNVQMHVEPNDEAQYAFEASNDEETPFINNESSKVVPQSTIATSVKSRQRMKRRFTDDIVDTDVGILSLNSMSSACRKAKADLHAPPQTQDIIKNFEINFNTEARGGPLTKIETVFSSKQAPVDICSCNGNTYEVKSGDTPKNFFCQAVDSYDEKLVGCSNPVNTFRLVRPSVRIPYTVMCEMHLWRMKSHQCCPRCGVFCSQGAVVQCVAEKHNHSIHLHHERCHASSTDAKFNFCLHCGSGSHLKVIRIECEMMTPPSFFQSQYTLTLISKARITCGMSANTVKQESDSASYKLCGDKVLNYDGLPQQDMLTLKSMIASLEGENVAELPDYPVIELYSAALHGDIKKVLHMLAKGVNPSEKYQEHDESCALHAAATSGNLLITHLLLQAGAVPDAMNRNLRTPLMIATENNHESVVESLVKHEAPINTKGEVGMTCLHLAARDGHLRLCKLFLDSGKARINAQDDGGWTPIVWASEHGHLDIVDLLISRGGDPNIRDNEGNTALHWAAFCGTVEVCTLLLDHNCCVNEANEHGDTPLHIAARQDNFRCIDLLLSVSANLEVRNRAGELPLDCCSNNPDSRSCETICSNMALKKLFRYPQMFERVVSKDIARGREQYPIRCINGVDNAELEVNEFLYVVENCETCPIKIDRCITSLQHCNCKDHCTISSCTCSAISFKCWYDKDGHLLPEFNMLDPPLLFECNRACSCDIGVCQNRVVQRGMTCRLELVRTVGRGWGVRTLTDIPKGTFICEYVGELITDSEADTRQDDSYLFDLDNKDGETYCLDARYFGNISRFINHFCEPNLIPVKVFIDHQDLSFPRIAFFSLRHIFQYEELGFDYGEKFWVIKSKSFTCNCESVKCKYSAETIKETLECYHNRIREELHEDMNMFSI